MFIESEKLAELICYHTCFRQNRNDYKRFPEIHFVFGIMIVFIFPMDFGTGNLSVLEEDLHWIF